MNQIPNPAIATEPTQVRLGVLGFACSLSLLTYLDRICIAQVQNHIMHDLQIDTVGMGLVFGAFSLGYMLFEVPGGWMGDLWGARRIITRIVIWWSIFTALTGYIDQLVGLGYGSDPLPPLVAMWSLIAVRFLFGCGEAGAYPNITRVVSNWFPRRERGLAQGAVWTSARMGGALAPFAIVWLTGEIGWRSAFVVLGGLGIIWCSFFYIFFRDRPQEVPHCNAAERALIRERLPSPPGEPAPEPGTHIAAGPPPFPSSSTQSAAGDAPHTTAPFPATPEPEDSHRGHPMPPWGLLVRSLSIWCLCLAGCGVSFGWYFYPTFQPRYLKDVYNIEYSQSAWMTALPFLFGACGAFIGGSLSDRLIRWTGSRRWGRSLVGVVGFTGAGCCVVATGYVTEYWQAVALLCLAFLINDLAIPPIWAVCSDIGGRFAGTISGIMNMVGALGAFLGPVVMGLLLANLPEEWSKAEQWRYIFIVLAVSWFIAAIAWLGIDASKPIIHDERTGG